MSITKKIDKLLEKYNEETNFLLEAEAEDATEELPKQKGNIEQQLITFLSENPNPSDKDMHSWTEENGFNVHEIETIAYKLATHMVNFLTGGDSVNKGVSKRGVDGNQLKLGMKIEEEHSTDPLITQKIALDHLSMDDLYYTHLKELEDKYEKK